LIRVIRVNPRPIIFSASAVGRLFRSNLQKELSYTS
jgi:hypothetical protein